MELTKKGVPHHHLVIGPVSGSIKCWPRDGFRIERYRKRMALPFVACFIPFLINASLPASFHFHKVLTAANGSIMTGQDNQTPFERKWTPGGNIVVNLKRAFRVRQPSVLIFARSPLEHIRIQMLPKQRRGFLRRSGSQGRSPWRGCSTSVCSRSACSISIRC